MDLRTTIRRWPGQLAVTLLGATALWLALAQGVGLWPGGRLWGAGALVYRVAFWLHGPAAGVLLVFSPEVAHHLPSWHLPVAALLTAFALWGIVVARRRLRARSGSKGQQRGATDDLDPAGAPEDADRTDGPADPDRRAVVSQVAAGAVGTALLGLGGYASLVEPQRLQLRRYRISIRGLPSWAEGLTLLHITDTHHGPFVSLTYLEEVVANANELRPDLVVLTGDYVHRTPAAIQDGIAVLGRLRGRLGVVAVLGNHDHWEGAGRCRQALRAAGVRVIDNSCLFLSSQGLARRPGAAPLCVAGVGDMWEDEHLPDPVLRHVPRDVPRLLLSHNPDVAELVSATTRVDLMLSGHTHGGQVSLPGLGPRVVPSAYGQKYAGGLCQGPSCRVLVSRGAGMAVLPVRFGVPPEIAW